MLINLRNALMAGKRLPYDAEVEYLEGTGTQYIDTGTPIAYNYRIELTFATTASGTQYIFGDSISSGALYRWAQTSANKFAIMTGSGSAIGTPPSISTNTVYTARVENKVCYLNDVQFATIAGSDPSTPRTAHAYLFTWNAATISGGKLRVYSCKIYDENGTLVRDYIPVRKGTVGYLYDRVSGKLFGNAGTGDFVLGQDVVPVEYIESHGTEWIDTGAKPTDSNGIKIEFLPIANASTNNIFGVYSRSSAISFRFTCNTSTASATGGYYWWNAGTSIANPSPWYNNKSTVSLNFLNDRKFIIDGIASYNISGTLTAMGHTLPILALNTPAGAQSPASARLYQCLISDGNATILHYKPVRVGTEGAMMDTLTRRIYRNQGTGAFGYGNDLKYPIPAS